MAHFYLTDAMTDVETGDLVALTGPEARHAVTVSRIALRESLTIGDGAGTVVAGPVVSAESDRVDVRVDRVRRVDRPTPGIRLAQALAKGGRDEAAVQAATELGVDGVIPWAANRSIVRWEGAKAAKNVERWSSIVREATKQSMRPWLPDVAGLSSTAQLASRAGVERILVLDPDGATPLGDLRPDGRDLVLVIGPEGGIAPEEIARLTDAGAETVRMGTGILRTSTAGPAAIAVLNVAFHRWT